MRILNIYKTWSSYGPVPPHSIICTNTDILKLKNETCLRVNILRFYLRFIYSFWMISPLMGRILMKIRDFAGSLSHNPYLDVCSKATEYDEGRIRIFFSIRS